MARKKITAIQKARLEVKLSEYKKEASMEHSEMTAAKEQGDMSENSELDSAKGNYALNRSKIAEIENILNNSDVVGETSGNIIDIGSLIRVYIKNKETNVYEEKGLFCLDSVEDFLGGILGENSPLGQAIRGNASGEFTVQTAFGDSVQYLVKKETNDSMDEFLASYPDKIELFK